MFFSFCIQAIIPLTALESLKREQEDQYLQKDYQHLHPVIGFWAYHTGFIANLRFFGNYNTGFKNGRREFSQDKAHDHDPVWTIVRILFPSTGGDVTTTSGALSNFGKHLNNSKIIAHLLEYATHIRSHHNSLDLKTFIKHTKMRFQDSFKEDPKELKKGLKKEINNLLKSIF